MKDNLMNRQDSPVPSLSADELTKAINTVARAAISVEQYSLVVESQALVKDQLQNLPKLQDLFSSAQSKFQSAARKYLSTDTDGYVQSIILTLSNAQALANNFVSAVSVVKPATGSALKTLLGAFFGTESGNLPTYKQDWDTFYGNFSSYANAVSDSYSNLLSEFNAYLGTEKSPTGLIISYFKSIAANLTSDLATIINGVSDIQDIKSNLTRTTVAIPHINKDQQAGFNLEVIELNPNFKDQKFNSQIQDYNNNVDLFGKVSAKLYPKVVKNIYPMVVAVTVLDQFYSFTKSVKALNDATTPLQTAWGDANENFKDLSNEISSDSDARIKEIQTEFVNEAQGWNNLQTAVQDLISAFSN